jgi:hypothetical protein
MTLSRAQYLGPVLGRGHWNLLRPSHVRSGCSCGSTTERLALVGVVQFKASCSLSPLGIARSYALNIRGAIVRSYWEYRARGELLAAAMQATTNPESVSARRCPREEGRFARDDPKNLHSQAGTSDTPQHSQCPACRAHTGKALYAGVLTVHDDPHLASHPIAEGPRIILRNKCFYSAPARPGAFGPAIEREHAACLSPSSDNTRTSSEPERRRLLCP